MSANGIGNIDLHDALQLIGLEESTDIYYEKTTYLSGDVDVQTMDATNVGRPLALLAAPRSGQKLPSGYFTLDQINSIKSIIKSGLPTNLRHHRGVFNVMVLKVEEPQQVFVRCNPSGSAWYTAKIKMIEV